MCLLVYSSGQSDDEDFHEMGKSVGCKFEVCCDHCAVKVSGDDDGTFFKQSVQDAVTNSKLQHPRGQRPPIPNQDSSYQSSV